MAFLQLLLIGIAFGLLLMSLVRAGKVAEAPPALYAPPRLYRVRWDDRFGSGPRMHVGGNRYYLRRAADFAVARFLRRLSRLRHECSRGNTPTYRLVAFREDFRRVIAARPIAGLVWSLRSGDAEVQQLALWLLGRCESTRATAAVATYRNSFSRSWRKEAARALRRMQAWSELREMSQRELEPAIRAFARPRLDRSWSERLGRLTHHTTRKASSLAPGACLSPAFEMNLLPGPSRPLKSAEYIRAILWRIHNYLRG